MGAHAAGASFVGARLDHSDLSHADLTVADFSSAHVFSANLHAVVEEATIWSNADTTSVKRTDSGRLAAEQWQPPERPDGAAPST